MIICYHCGYHYWEWPGDEAINTTAFMTPSILTLTMILSETCATTVSGLESLSFVLAFNDTTNEKYLQTNINVTLIICCSQS